MENKLIRDYWTIIAQKDRSGPEHYLKPLSHLEKFLAAFGLSVNQPNLNLVAPVQNIGDVKPAFKNLTDEILLQLRYEVYAQKEPEQVSPWAEKLMRFCEVRYHDLEKRTVAKLGDRAAARLHFLHLMVFLMDYGVFSGDPRYLNIVLKLERQRWAFDESAIKKALSSRGAEFLAGLFHFRLLLLTEYGLSRISKGPAL